MQTSSTDISCRKLFLVFVHLSQILSIFKFKNIGYKLIWQWKDAQSCQNTGSRAFVWFDCLWCVLRADIVVQWGTAGQAAIVQDGFKNTSLVINNIQPLFKQSTVADNPSHLTSRQNVCNTFTICSRFHPFNKSIILFIC